MFKSFFTGKKKEYEIQITKQIQKEELNTIDSNVLLTVKIESNWKQIKVFIQDKKGRKGIIKIDETKEMYLSSLFFDRNDIIVGYEQDGKNVINEFVENIMTDPYTQDMHRITFQSQSYIVLMNQ